MKKLAFSSKKFIAFFATMIIVAGILITALLTQTFVWAMAAFMGIGILVIGVMAIAYVNNQATLDRFIEAVKGLPIKKEEDE